MSALTRERNTPRLGNDIHPFDRPIKGSTKLFGGSLVGVEASSGLVVPMAAGLNTIVPGGRCTKTYDNSLGADSAFKVAFESGTFRWANGSGGDAIGSDDIGKTAYALDDQTVSIVPTGHSPAGIIVDVDAIGVWVHTDFSAQQLLIAGSA